MKIEIWSDLICPWCGLGQHRLAQALASFEHRDRVVVVHRSFELDPHFPEGTVSVRDVLARKYRLDPSRLDAMFQHVESMAKREGLQPYVVGDNMVGNTRLAHELLAMASERGLEGVAWERLYRAYFAECRSIFEVDALVELAPEIGLDPGETRNALQSGRHRNRVVTDGVEARALGATGVPFIAFDRRIAIAGAQPVSTLLRLLADVWAESRSRHTTEVTDEVCGPDGCGPVNPVKVGGET